MSLLTKWKTTIPACLIVFISLLSLATAGTYTTGDATLFTFSETGVEVQAGPYDGYSTEGTDVSIEKPGNYVFSGSCPDGSITVEKGVEDVTLVFNGLTLSNETTAPVLCKKNSTVTIVAAADTENTLSDTAYNNDDTYPDNEDAENAVIKCKSGTDVAFRGTGALTVNGAGKNGIKSGAEAYLTFDELTLTVSSQVNDAISADNVLTVFGGTLDLNAADDAVKSSADEDDESSVSEIIITGGTFTISASGDAVSADGNLVIGTYGSSTGPEFNIVTCNEGFEGMTVTLYSGTGSITSTDDGVNAANSDIAESGDMFAINITGGDWTINAGGDGIDSNGNVTMTGGTVIVFGSEYSDNSALDYDGTFELDGGTLFAAGSSGMAMTPTSSASSQSFVTFSLSGTATQPGGMTWSAQDFGGPEDPDQGAAVAVINAGDTLSVIDSGGNVLLTTAAAHSVDSIVFSTGGISGTLTLTVNGEAVAYSDDTIADTPQDGPQTPQDGQAPQEGPQMPQDNPQVQPDGPQQQDNQQQVIEFSKYTSRQPDWM